MDYYIGDRMKENGIDISKEQFLLLKYLDEKDGRVQNELAFITNRSKTSLTRLVNTMQKKELVYRSVCHHDMRINHIYLTELGKEVWKKSFPIFQSIILELQQGIPESDLLLVRKTMEHIQLNINKKTNINP